MKLLIVTQVVDIKDPILGFFHTWLAAFAQQCEQVTVICLREGRHDLPDNVRVLSLGKERGGGRMRYVARFYKLVWQERRNYDAVFVHMNPEYVVLAGVLWRLMRKSVGMWYAHGAISFKLRVATMLVHTVYSSTPAGFRIDTPKTQYVGQGIDCCTFRYSAVYVAHKLVTVGRYSRVKKLEFLVNVLRNARSRGFSLTFDMYGAATTIDEMRYLEELKALISEFNMENVVSLNPPVSQQELPNILETYGIFISASQTGSLDKALLEAMATGRIVLSTNPGIQIIDEALEETSFPMYVAHDEELFATALLDVLQTDAESLVSDRKLLSTYVCESHSISQLASKIIEGYDKIYCVSK